MDAIFLDHYDRELGYLREQGSQSAALHPKLASRLGMDDFHCQDPFVERLLEGFAFMAARVHRRMDAEFPEFARSLLDSIAPHLTRPIPSMAIMEIRPDANEGSLLSGYCVAKGTRLHASPAVGEQTGCRFDTCADVTLWPIEIHSAQILSRESASSLPIPLKFRSASIRYLLHLEFKSLLKVPFQKLSLDNLRLHLRGESTASHLLEALIAHSAGIAIGSHACESSITENHWTVLPNGRVSHWGFDRRDMILPLGPQTFSGHQLLQEYFALPEKFCFVEVQNMGNAIQNQTGSHLHVLIGLNHAASSLVGRISKENFALHCVPAVNLFKRRADRTRLDHSQHEHQVIADRSRPLDYEVWSIEEMSAHQAATAYEETVMPMYSPVNHSSNSLSNLRYAIARHPRLVAQSSRYVHRTNYLGSEVFVSLACDIESMSSRFDQLGSTVWCTNRDLPLIAPEGGWKRAFTAETSAPIETIVCLTGPTAPRTALASDDGKVTWHLINHLTPNYMSLIDKENGGAEMLRETLALYVDPTNASRSRQVEGVASIAHRDIVRRLEFAQMASFAKGIAVELCCDETMFSGGTAFLLGSILEQFFARYVHLSSFTEFQLVSANRGIVHHWPARIGTTHSV